MKTVKINNLGFLEGPSVKDAMIDVEITEEESKKISNWPASKIWQYDWENKTFNLVQTPYFDGLRFARQVECFDIINRGQGWYLLLTEDQKKELTEWYKAWLDVTETGIIPKKPSWIK